MIISDLQEQLDQLNQLSQNKESDIKVGSNVTGDDAIPETDEDKALAEQMKKENEAAEKGETIVQPTIPQEEYTDFVIPEGFGGPGRITKDSPAP